MLRVWFNAIFDVACNGRSPSEGESESELVEYSPRLELPFLEMSMRIIAGRTPDRNGMDTQENQCKQSLRRRTNVLGSTKPSWRYRVKTWLSKYLSLTILLVKLIIFKINFKDFFQKNFEDLYKKL